MKKLADWVKTHKLNTFLLCVVVFLLAKYLTPGYGTPMPMAIRSGVGMSEMASPMSAGFAMDSYQSKVTSNFAPPPSYPARDSVDLSATDRRVVRNSDISLLVKDVRASIDSITQHATSVGGFMVNSSVQTPEEGGSGYVSIRVPANSSDSTLSFLRNLGVRVVSENVTGTDVTDQFTDTQARLETLNQTKVTFEGMLTRATTVDEILRVQQSILQVQDQIDSLKGQLQYLEKTSQSSFISVYLSTDELSLPYSPSEPWRPSVVFKTAVRSLVGNLRILANASIWMAVYSPLILVGLLVIWFIRKRMK